jgi:hypothetical protein
MARKFTKSQDGQERCTISIKLRVTPGELTRYEERAKDLGMSVSEFLYTCLIDGIEMDETRQG